MFFAHGRHVKLLITNQVCSVSVTSSDKSECYPEQSCFTVRSRVAVRPGRLWVLWPEQRLNESNRGLSMIYSYQCSTEHKAKSF